MLPFDKLRPEYEALIAQAVIRGDRRAEVEHACEDLLKHKQLFLEAADATTVHPAVLMALAEREMSGRVDCYLGNGQKLSMHTTIVPKGRGPFTGPHAFADGCKDACHLDGLDKVGAWDAARAAYEFELFNGDGYRRRGLPSSYVFGATSVQKPGKFVADHVFDYTVMDGQVGTLAIIETLAALDPSLALPGLPTAKSPETPVLVNALITGPDVRAMQQYLNRLKVDGTPLAVDGSFGRRTRYAMQAYQRSKRLPVTVAPVFTTMKALIDDADSSGA